MGRLLQSADNLEMFKIHAQPAKPDGIRASLEALPANVCKDWNCDGQRATSEGHPHRALDSGSVPQALRSQAHARAEIAGELCSKGAAADSLAWFRLSCHAEQITAMSS